MRAPPVPTLAVLRGRPAALALLGLLLAALLGLVAGPVSAVLERQDDIERARALLARTQALTAAGAAPAPLWAAEPAALATAFRARLDDLAASRAVVIEAVSVEADPGRPAAPWLVASVRGTTEGVHGLLLALETQPPFVVVETADVTVAGPADPARDKPTILAAVLRLRGFVAAAPAPGRSSGSPAGIAKS